MIFVTVGSELPFNRLIEAVDVWTSQHPDRVVFAQVGCIGAGDYQPKHMRWAALLPPVDFSRRVAEADLLVAHAGMGSILNALTAAVPIVVLPRRGHLAETRNDHQVATARHLQSFDAVHVAWNEGEVGARIDAALEHIGTAGANGLTRFASPAFTGRLRAFLVDKA